MWPSATIGRVYGLMLPDHGVPEWGEGGSTGYATSRIPTHTPGRCLNRLLPRRHPSRARHHRAAGARTGESRALLVEVLGRAAELRRIQACVCAVARE